MQTEPLILKATKIYTCTKNTENKELRSLEDKSWHFTLWWDQDTAHCMEAEQVIPP